MSGTQFEEKGIRKTAKMKKLLVIIFTILLPAWGAGQNPEEGGIKWYSMEQAIKLNREHPKKIFIYIYSDHCGWCRKMAGHTLTNPVIASYLNEKYYPVKLNEAMKEDLTVGSKTYKYVPADPVRKTPSYHEFIVFILQGNMAFPSEAFLDQNLAYLGLDRGYKPPADFEKVLHFIGDEVYKQNPDYEKYAAGFSGKL